jgi:hypothetical protein
MEFSRRYKISALILIVFEFYKSSGVTVAISGIKRSARYSPIIGVSIERAYYSLVSGSSRTERLNSTVAGADAMVSRC